MLLLFKNISKFFTLNQLSQQEPDDESTGRLYRISKDCFSRIGVIMNIDEPSAHVYFLDASALFWKWLQRHIKVGWS